MIFPQNPVLSDICATVISGFIVLSVLRVWEETAKRGLFDQVKTPPTWCLTCLPPGFAAALYSRFSYSCKKLPKRGLGQQLNRKLVHISIGLVFMLCWPLFSSRYRGAIFATFTIGINIIQMLVIGSGIWKNEATMKSMTRYGDYKELLKGPLYYAVTITLACALYWRTSPIAIAAICNLCAGDGNS